MANYASGASGSAAPARAEAPASAASRSAPASVSAGIAAANAHLPDLAERPPAESGPRFPAEDGGRSLAAMAERDLDAALQLLAERAQYISGASGAAIALRRGQHKDMLCRASAGSNAPELGSLLSMEYGLSGESVRTRQVLRCDDTERDSRVNREGCRQLGIASVVVMPIVCEEQAIGVFELFSGKPNAFGERDVSALRRLSEMVETAVQYATAMQNVATEAPLVGVTETTPPMAGTLVPVAQAEGATLEELPEVTPADVSETAQSPEVVAMAPPPSVVQVAKMETTAPPTTSVEQAPVEMSPRAPFWSAAVQKSVSPPTASFEVEPATISVPAVLRNLQKCSACGFPISQGRVLCVECEQKKWSGEVLPRPVAAEAVATEIREDVPSEAPPVIRTATNTVGVPAAAASEITASTENAIPTPHPNSPHPNSPQPELPAPAAATATEDISQDLASAPRVEASENSAAFLSSAMPSESWLAANKYILVALLVVAAVIAAVGLLR